MPVNNIHDTIIQELGGYLYGSRSMGEDFVTNESDWDYAVEHKASNISKVYSLGFSMLWLDDAYSDVMTSGIATHPDYPDIQIVFKYSMFEFKTIWESITKEEYMNHIFKQGFDGLDFTEEMRKAYIRDYINNRYYERFAQVVLDDPILPFIIDPLEESKEYDDEGII